MSEQVRNFGFGLTDLLTIVFVVLKLCGVISWSWWWVVSPSLIAVGIGLIIWIVTLIFIKKSLEK